MKEILPREDIIAEPQGDLSISNVTEAVWCQASLAMATSIRLLDRSSSMAPVDVSVSLSPLAIVTEDHLHGLGRTLWSWSPCEDCNPGPCHKIDTCPSHRSKRLARFFEYYKHLTSSYEPELGSGEEPALNTHEELFDIIQQLKSEPDVTREQFAIRALENRPGRRPPPAADRERAINLAVKIMTTVNCSAQRQSSGLLEHSASPITWRSDVTFSDFMLSIFPMTDHPSFNDDDLKFQQEMKTALMAKRLKKRLGLRFQPTDDLRRHLMLDRKNNVIDIYHNTAFLKEHLRLTKYKPPNLSMSETLKL